MISGAGATAGVSVAAGASTTLGSSTGADIIADKRLKRRKENRLSNQVFHRANKEALKG